MPKLPLAPATAKAVQAYLQLPSAVLLLHGPTGVGKLPLAEYIISEVLGIHADKLAGYPYLLQVNPDGTSISIERIREVQSQLVRSVPGTHSIRRVVLIVNAQALTTEAQNALLKSLEEAPADTLFVLTVDNLNHLLSTVVSRAQSLAVLPLSEGAAKQSFGDTPETIKAFHMSGGRAALLQALLDDATHPLLAAIDQAKDVLRKTPYERLLLVNMLSKDKPAATELIEALGLVARVSLNTSVKAAKTGDAKRWHAIARHVAAAEKALNKNASTKLVLTDLFLHL